MSECVCACTRTRACTCGLSESSKRYHHHHHHHLPTTSIHSTQPAPKVYPNDHPTPYLQTPLSLSVREDTDALRFSSLFAALCSCSFILFHVAQSIINLSSDPPQSSPWWRIQKILNLDLDRRLAKVSCCRAEHSTRLFDTNALVLNLKFKLGGCSFVTSKPSTPCRPDRT